MRRFAIVVFSIIMLCLTLGFFLLPPYPITVTQTQINQAITDRLPLATDQSVGSAIVNAGTVTLQSGNRVATTWELATRTPIFSGNVAVSAALKIHYEDGAFYLKDLKSEDVQLAFLAEDADASETHRRDLGDLLVQGARNALRAVTDERVASQAFDPELTEALKRLLGRILEEFLNTFPVYDLRSAGGTIALAALVLEDVSVSDGQVTATFAAQRLLGQFVAGVLFILAMLLFVGRTAPLGRGS
ncbi:MAG: hypothetical protein AAFY14_05110 [Pseudomonadota bacterium]